MTLEEARRILGLSADEDPREHMVEFAAARERIAELVRTAPNETIAVRYQDGLIDFDRALAAVKEDLNKEHPDVIKRREWMRAARGSDVTPEEEAVLFGSATKTVRLVPIAPPALPGAVAKAAAQPEESPAAEAEAHAVAEFEANELPDRPAERGMLATISIILLVAAVVGGLGYVKMEERDRFRVQERLTFLERLGAKMIEARQWPEADLAYKEIEELNPNSKVAALGRRSIEAGMDEEQRQFVGYWSGQAIAEFEAGRLDEAAAASRKVLEKYPDQKESAALLEKIEAARSTAARESLLASATAAIQKRHWDEAEAKANELAKLFPGDPEGTAMLSDVRAGREKEARDRVRARELFSAAKVRDQGAFDHDALQWLREATSLAPDDPEITELYKKMASYTRTLQVPGDYATLADAVAASRDNDRIAVGEGTWIGPIVVDKAITLEGAGRDKTIVETDAATGTAATFGRQATGSRVSGITFRHRGFDPGPNRFSALQVRGAEVTMNDCRVADSTGHGLAVIEAGRVGATRCAFENNGWDGVSVSGAGSRVEFSECDATGNFGHGFDLWDGGSALIDSSTARDNAGNGILVDTNADNVVLSNNDLRANREFGIVVSSAASGRVFTNECRENLLGGMAVRFAAARLTFEGNKLDKNLGPGLALERGLKEQSFSTNTATANTGGKNTVTNADFSSGE